MPRKKSTSPAPIEAVKHPADTRTSIPATEIIFLVEDAPEGGYMAKAVGASIFTQAETWAELQQQVRDAVDCHFEATDKPQLIRLHFVREEVIAA